MLQPLAIPSQPSGFEMQRGFRLQSHMTGVGVKRAQASTRFQTYATRNSKLRRIFVTLVLLS
jgi:hypothetical protein